MDRRNAAAAHLHDSPIQVLPTPPIRVDHTKTAGGACAEASSSHGGMQADAAAQSNAHGGAGVAVSSHTCMIQSPMAALPTPPMCAQTTTVALWSSGSCITKMDLVPCMASNECNLMERMEDANMCAYPRLRPPFNAYEYFQSY